MNTAKKPPIVVIEPEDNQMVYITGSDVEAIDSQTVQVVAWVDQPHTNSRKIVLRVAMSLKLAIEANIKMQKAITDVISMVVEEGRDGEPKKNTIQ